MTTILVIIIIYLVIAHIFNFVAVACDCLLESEELILNLLWIIFVPAAILNEIIKKCQRKSRRKKQK